MDARRRFLIIRLDNIGDLVCTTPMFRALRERFPDARICALVNSYIRPVLDNNPDIDEVFAYTKAKHRPQGRSWLSVQWELLRTLARLRRERFDYAINARPGFFPRGVRYAWLARAKHIIGFTEEGKRGVRRIDMGVPYTEPEPIHHAVNVFRLLAPLGIEGAPPALRVVATPSEVAVVEDAVRRRNWPSKRTLVGVHISAREADRRWPPEHFARLLRMMRETHDVSFLLFWSPEDLSKAAGQGDDMAVETVVRSAPEVPILPYPTARLEQLIAGLSVCRFVICSDGGTLHLAAGLGKPIVYFFGKGDPRRWHPWGVPHVVLRSPGRDVKDISPAEARAAFEKLCAGS